MVMGCQMTVSRRYSDKDAKTPNLLSLPTEVLLKIISHLPETLDRIRLRYVSRRLRSISETPSVWRELVWPDCDRHEENCLRHLLKICGIHIRRLYFPQHVIGPLALPTIVNIISKDNQTILKLVEMSEVLKILQYCSNVTHLSLPVLDHPISHDPDEELKEAIQKMEHLTSLSVHCHGSFLPYLTLTVPLKELTIHTTMYSLSGSLTILHREESCLSSISYYIKWLVENGFSPQNLNIVLDSSYDSTWAFDRETFKLLAFWATWNSQIPVDHVACLKLYISYKTPLNLFHNAPVFQLQFGETATLPFLQYSNIDEWLLLTDHDDGSHKGTICIRQNASRMYEIIDGYGQYGVGDQENSITNLTELDLSNYKLDCTKLIMAYPQLQRLSIRNNENLRIEDLQVIATCCSNLQGLNISVRCIEFFMKMWEILSGMKLTHLRMDDLLFNSPSKLDVAQVEYLIALFQQCITLRALELYYFSIPFDNYKLLSYFPSLEYCRLYHDKHSIFTHDILATCKKLRCFNLSYCHYCIKCMPQPPLVSAYNNNLQQLCIFSLHTDLHDTFMDTVSAHGGLIHVALHVHSVSSKGITTLIKNSPNLLSFRLHEHKEHTKNYCSSLSASLSKKFADRKLFTSGLFSIVQHAHRNIVYSQESSYVDGMYIDYDQWLENTDLLSLWPPNHLYDGR